MRRIPPMTRAGIATGLYVVLWGAASFIFDIELLDTAGWVLFYLIGLCWTVYYIERTARKLEAKFRPADSESRLQALLGNEPAHLRKTWNPFDPASRFYDLRTLGILFLITASFAVAAWAAAFLMLASASRSIESIANFKSWYFAQLMKAALTFSAFALLWLSAIFAQSRKLRQSLGSLAAYSVLFVLLYLLVHIRFGSGNGELENEIPAGGGNDAPQAMSVKVQKVIRKKYVVNPYSSILFAAPPPIENVDVKLTEETANRYQVGQGDGGLGQGDGEGGGFGSGSGKGKIRFYRLRHADKSWDKNFGIDLDRNLLTELEARFPKMKGRVAEETESLDCVTLGQYKEKAAPHLVYVGGNSFNPSAADKRLLKQYLIERHGMILGDSLGPGFHGGFIAAMTEITGVKPVVVPRDDPIHKRPFEIPQLPYQVAHGGTEPYGWKVDGRWAVYWHPGALSDGWRTDRAGMKKAISDQCFQLGLNIVSYSLREYDKWRQSGTP